MHDVLIIGGGLAGLISGLELARSGHSVVLVERKTYPFHKVCGEYISNEVRPYLESLGLDLRALGATSVDRLLITSPSGRPLREELDLGGFGLSRYTLDQALFGLGTTAGVTFLTGKSAETVEWKSDRFGVALADGRTLESRVVIGAFGKRSRLDKHLGRAFMQRPSPYVGVKYHVRTDFPTDTIALHNFFHGYCGLSSIEDGKFCLCYLTVRDNLRRYGTIPAMEAALLHRNPHLKRLYAEAEFLYDKPEVINEFSFAPKKAVEQHVLMAGDSAGLITPLCGNGMAMAIHGGKLVSGLTAAFLRAELTRPELEQRYQVAWSRLFSRRLWVGRTVQRLFGEPWLSEASMAVFGAAKPLLRQLIRRTHGPVVPV